MSDYTPTTELIEANYVHSNAIQRAGFGNTNADYSAEFDRWLAQHDSEVAKEALSKMNGWLAEHDSEVTAKAEQRIIKLLEDKRNEIRKIVTMSEELGETGAKWFYQDRVRELDNYIALIKEEQK